MSDSTENKYRGTERDFIHMSHALDEIKSNSSVIAEIVKQRFSGGGQPIEPALGQYFERIRTISIPKQR